MKSRLGSGLLLLMCAALTSVARGADEHRIRLAVPYKAGDKRALAVNGKQELHNTARQGEQVLNEQRQATEFAFEGTVETLAVDDQGRETRIAITVEKFSVLPAGEEAREVLPTGTKLVAESKAGGTLYQHAEKKEELDSLARLLLPRIVNTEEDTASEVEIFHTTEARKVGDTWTGDEALLKSRFKQLSPLDKVEGQAKFISVRTENGRELLEIEMTLGGQGTGPAPVAQLTPGQCEIRATVQMLLPGDGSTNVVERTSTSHIKQILHGKTGTPQEGVEYDGRSTESRTTKVKYLK